MPQDTSLSPRSQTGGGSDRSASDGIDEGIPRPLSLDGEASEREHSIDAVPRIVPSANIRRNPPVTIEDWPEPEDEELDSDNEAKVDNPGDYACVDDLDDVSRLSSWTTKKSVFNVRSQVPHDYDEGGEAALQFAQISDDQFREFLIRELGDSYDEEWDNLYNEVLSTNDVRTVKILSAKLRAHFSKESYDEIRYAFAQEIGLPSEFVAWRRVRILSTLESAAYDCCINSCCAFLGKYRDLTACSYCKEARFKPNGQPRKVFHFIPLIPQLQALFRNPEIIKLLQYRSQQQSTYSAHIIRDVFDGAHFRALLEKAIRPNTPSHFFDLATDIALGLSLDGFTLFKRCQRGNSTAWPLLVLNYNLPPEIRTHLEHVICIGAIPGPRQFKDLNSFLIPLLEELLQLETGVDTCDHSVTPGPQRFTLRAFLILAFGDIPALTKLLGVKGHNAVCPCRTCDITGVKDDRPTSHVHYVPLTLPGQKEYWDPHQLPMREPNTYRKRIAEIEAAPTKTAKEKLARKYGINSRCILSVLRSIDIVASFPYDFMHLMYENLVPNLIKHWTGKFKRLDQGSGHYELTDAQWNAIGVETAAATKTIPSVFVGTLQDISQDGNLYKAEAHGFWIQYVAPIVLRGRLATKYYDHIMDLRKILDLCLQYEITRTQVDHLETLIIRWVANYEAYYYQYKVSRVSACPLTIHALLHIPFYIRQAGPVWAYWAYVMERFCGSLLQAVRNRLNPYPCIDNYLLRRAQLLMISSIYQVPTLQSRSAPSHTVTEFGIKLSKWDVVYDEYPTSVLSRPIIKHFQVDTALLNQLVSYFQVVLKDLNLTIAGLKNIINVNSVVRYGRVRNANGGDPIRTAAVDREGRDNSFVRYTMFPDRNASRRNREDVPYRQINYGQLLDVFFVRLHEHGDSDILQKYLLARVLPCEITRGEDAANEVVEFTSMAKSPIIINLLTIEGTIGRVLRHKTWAIIDRSRDAVRTLFTNDDNMPTGFDS